MGKLPSTDKLLLPLFLAALGVSWGDIANPRYAIRESSKGLPVTTDNVLGIVSPIFWPLILGISIKYPTIYNDTII